MSFAAIWMDLLSEVSQRKTNIVWQHLHAESKVWHKRWIYLWKRDRLTDIESRQCWPKCREGRRGMEPEFEISRYKLLYIEQTNNKVLLHSTDNYIQYSVINNNGKNVENNLCIYMNIYIFPSGSAGKNLPAMQGVQSVFWEDPLEKEMATHSSMLVQEIPMDREAWWAVVHGIAKELSITWQLKQYSSVCVCVCVCVCVT